MCIIAYHASHEQFAPSSLLRYAVDAERAGFQAIHCSDHFQPWNNEQGHSGHSLAWLGAALQACTVPVGVICAPGPRHHPMMLAQAVATLSEMYPDRFWVSLGSGEAINERVTGEPWPDKPTRNMRLKEAFDMMKSLLKGQRVTRTGHFEMSDAKLFTLPDSPPPLFGAALSEETAHGLGAWAEGLLTVGHDVPQLKRVIQAFHEGGGKGKPVYVKVQLSYARDEAVAKQEAYEQWRTNILDDVLLAELWRVEQFEAAAEFVKPDDLVPHLLISSDVQRHIDYMQQYQALGVDALILHNVNKQQADFIEDFGSQVLPALQGS